MVNYCSPLNISISLILLLSIVQNVVADHQHFHLKLREKWVNPDGRKLRKVITVNDHFPPPIIRVQFRNTVTILVENELSDGSSIHWHGLYQQGHNIMDGAVGVSQCEIPPHSNMTYEFKVEQTGTYWYHSHARAQYPDGLRGAFIVEDNNPPFQAHDDFVLTLSDWYHEPMKELVKKYISPENPTGIEPIPKSALINDVMNNNYLLAHDKCYYLRIINLSAFASHYFWIQDAVMKIVEIDGVYVKPTQAKMLSLATGQRYGVIFCTTANHNYAFGTSMELGIFDSIPADLSPNATGSFHHLHGKPTPTLQPVDKFDPIDDFLLQPLKDRVKLQRPWHRIVLDVEMKQDSTGASLAYVNNQSYRDPEKPTLYKIIEGYHTEDELNSPSTYPDVNPYIIQYDKVVEIVVNNKDTGKHPFHMHGHTFQLLHRSKPNAGPYDPATNIEDNRFPMRRDTVIVNPNGNIVIRFRATNPGVWLFHCHMEWHMAAGLAVTIIEAPYAVYQLQKTIPSSHREACKKLSSTGSQTKAYRAH